MLIGLPPRSVPSAQIFRRGALASSLAEITAVLGAWRQRYRYRGELRRLMSSGSHLIEDIGLAGACQEGDGQAILARIVTAGAMWGATNV